MTIQEQHLIYETIHASAEGYTITIPQEMIEKLNLKEGDKIVLQIHPSDSLPDEESRQILQEIWEEHKEAFLYLKGR